MSSQPAKFTIATPSTEAGPVDSSLPSPEGSDIETGEQDEPEQASDSPVEDYQPIIYKNEYFERGGNASAIFLRSNEKNAAQNAAANTYSGPVMEYVDYFITEPSFKYKQREEEKEESEFQLLVSHRDLPYIRILSPCVMEALRCVVAYFPGQNLSSDSIKIYAPYRPLIFYEKELNDYCQRLENEPLQPGETCANHMALGHIRIVQEFVTQKIGTEVEEERKRHARGFATFDMLWLLYKPGVDVYVDEEASGVHEPFILDEVTLAMASGALTDYVVQFWNLRPDQDWIGPVLKSEEITRFAGEKRIASLTVFPCDSLQFDDEISSQDVEAIRLHFVNRGKQWYSLRNQSSFCQDFDGWNTDWPRRAITSLVMVDEVYYGQSDREEIGYRLVDDISYTVQDTRICGCVRCHRLLYDFRPSDKVRFAGYSRINPLTHGELTDHQYFLVTREVHAFVFRTRSWEHLHISGFRQPQYDQKLLERLVMKQETKDLITDLIRMYTRDRATSADRPLRQHAGPFPKLTDVHKAASHSVVEPTWTADFLAGKGDGLTFLLHGKPGVGKTHTAECIAHYTERPLLTLTCSDIGVNPQEIEERLLSWFKLAEHWGALILIDEADIYMEERRSQDIERNHLVASFIRALEYFKGILFLTTNRVGTFDEAFVSRIHVQIHYKLEDEDREKIWGNFFEKLEDDRETTMRIPIATKDYIQSKELRDLKWNGREIRNAFQIAVALAEARADKDKQGRILIKAEHIRASVQMSNEFQQYLESVHRQDLEKRALAQGLRDDKFGSRLAVGGATQVE